MRGEEVPITLDEIYKFYNIPYYEEYYIDTIDLNKFSNINMEDVMKFLTQGRGN